MSTRGKSGAKALMQTKRHKHLAKGRGRRGGGAGGPEDEMAGFTKSAIKTMSLRGGVKMIAAPVYPAARLVMRNFLHSVIKDTLTYVEYGKRKTVTPRDVTAALQRHHRAIYGYGGK